MFDKAALTWQWSLAFEILAGGLGVWLSLNDFSDNNKLIGAFLILTVLVFAYILRYWATGIYDDAETMRRQAAMSEGMGWELNRAELLDWRNRAGPRIMQKAELNPRPDDYYDNELGDGTRKLAQMTFESAYWTRCLYKHLRGYLVIALVGAVFLVVSLVLLALFDVVPAGNRLAIAYAAFLIAPIALTIDFLGMVLKLSRAIEELKTLSTFLEERAKKSSPRVGDVMRLVAEYNCVVSSGVPIPNWIWKRHGESIAAGWRGV